MVAICNKTFESYLTRICTWPLALAILCVFSTGITRAQTDSSKNVDSAQLKKFEGERKVNPFSQIEPNSRSASAEEVKALFTKIVTNPPTERVYFINGNRVSVEKVKRLKYENITDMQMLPPEDAMKKFGATGEKGVIAFLTRK